MIVSIDNTTTTLSLVKMSRELSSLSANLPVTSNKMRPTLSFLRNVVEWMQKQGMHDATITSAWQLWKVVSEATNLARSNEEPNAEVAYWYGVDPNAISESQQLGLLENLPKLIAQERIYHGNYSPSDPGSVYALFMSAFDDETVARKAQLDAAKALVDRATKRLN